MNTDDSQVLPHNDLPTPPSPSQFLQCNTATISKTGIYHFSLNVELMDKASEHLL